MGCFHTKQTARLHPEDDAAADTMPTTGSYVHYLAETAPQWQLILYNLDEKKFLTLKLTGDLLVPACESVIVGTTLYCVGGMDPIKKGLASREVKSLCFAHRNPQPIGLPAMKFARCRHGLVTLSSELICALGGFEQEGAMLPTCEVFDIPNNIWTSVGSMNYPRVCVASCILNNRFIYVFGGRTKPRDCSIDPYFIECMDYLSETKIWHVVEYESTYSHPDPKKLWCTPISSTEIILFGTERTTIFDSRTRKLYEEEADSKLKQSRCIPDKRGEVQKNGDEICMIMEAGGNVGIYSLSAKKWRVQPHIILGF